MGGAEGGALTRTSYAQYQGGVAVDVWVTILGRADGGAPLGNHTLTLTLTLALALTRRITRRPYAQ